MIFYLNKFCIKENSIYIKNHKTNKKIEANLPLRQRLIQKYNNFIDNIKYREVCNIYFNDILIEI